LNSSHKQEDVISGYLRSYRKMAFEQATESTLLLSTFM